MCSSDLSRSKVDIQHVPYRGSAPATQDLLAGQIHMMFDNIPGTLTQSRAGKVRPRGVTSTKRSPVAPEIPAIAETLPGMDMISWTTLTGPAKLPPNVVERLSELSKKALESEAPEPEPSHFKQCTSRKEWRRIGKSRHGCIICPTQARTEHQRLILMIPAAPPSIGNRCPVI